MLMSAPKYVTEEEYFRRMTDFTGYIGHMNNQTKSELRKEIILSEERIKTELRAEIVASEERVKTELRTEIAAVEARVTKKIDALAGDLAVVKADVASLKTDVTSLRADVDSLKAEMKELRTHTLENHKMLQLVLDQLSAMRSERRRD